MLHHDSAAGFVIFRKNRAGERTYLVIKSIAGHWELPKGHSKPGETWIQTAIRELMEETGITDANPIGGFARQIKYVFRDRRSGLFRKKVCFAVSRTRSQKVRLSDEHTEFAFLPIQRAIDQLTHAGTRAVLRDAEIFLSKTQTD